MQTHVVCEIGEKIMFKGELKYRIAQNFRWIKISLNAHTLYWHKNFAEFNFPTSRVAHQEVVGGALE